MNSDLTSGPGRPGLKRDILPVAGIIAAVVVLFGDHILHGLTVAIVSMEGSSQWNPFWTFARNELARGHFPLWTPYSLGGWSFPGFPHTAAFYPLSLFLYLLPYETGATYNAMFHMLLSALLMYRFLKGAGGSRFASFAGSLVWTAGGLYFVYLNFVPLLWTITWTPLFFDSARRWMECGRSRHFALFALAAALQLLGGSAESLLFEVISLAIILPVLCMKGLKANPYRGAALLLALGITALIASMQLLPAMVQLKQSIRSHGIGYEYFSLRGVSLKLWLMAALPATMRKIGNTSGEEYFYFTYIGVAAVAFAAYSLFAAKAEAKSLSRRIMLLALITALLLTRDLPVIGHILYRTPLLNLLREPAYDLFVPQFLIIILATRGIDALLGKTGDITENNRKKALGIGYAVAALVVAVFLALTAHVVEHGTKQYGLAAWIAVSAIVFPVLIKYRPASLKAAAIAIVLGVLLLDNFASAWLYLPRHKPGRLEPNADYSRFFASVAPFERHVVLDALGPLTADLPQHGGMIINAQTLGGWEGLPNLRFIMFLDLLDDRSIEFSGKKLKGIGYHNIFREGKFIDPQTLPFLNLAGVRYVVSRDFPVKFSSPVSIADLAQGIKVAPAGAMDVDVKNFGGQLLKLLVFKAGARAEMDYYVSNGDSLAVAVCTEGVITGEFEIAVRDKQDDVVTSIDKTPLGSLPACPGNSKQVSLDRWYGKVVKLEFTAYANGNGEVVMVEPEIVNPGKQFQRLAHGSIDIYWNKDAFPRAFFAHIAAASSGIDESAAWLAANRGSLRYKAPVEGGNMALPLFSQTTLEELATREKAIILKYEPDLVDIESRSIAPGYLILSDVYYPGWQVTVDGAPARDFSAYLAFRAVPLENPGKHNVEFVYKPISFRIGLWTALSAMLFWITWTAWPRGGKVAIRTN